MTKAIMAIHGFLTSVDDFGRLYDYLDFYDEVVPVQIPGHDGEVDFSQFTVEGTIDAVNNIFDKLSEKYDEVDVVGFSMGGALTSYLCATRNVHKAVMLAPANKYINLESTISATKYYLQYLSKAFGETTGTLKDRVEATHNEFETYRSNINATSQVAVKRFLPNLNIHTFKVFREIISIANKAVQDKKSIDTPSLVMWGRLDELVPRSSMQFIEDHFTDCKVKVIEDIGHLLLMTNKDNELIEDIIKFLSDGKVVKEIPLREAIEVNYD